MYTEKVSTSPSCSCSCSLERLIMTFPDRQATGLNLTSQGFVYMAIMILMLLFPSLFVTSLATKSCFLVTSIQNLVTLWLDFRKSNVFRFLKCLIVFIVQTPNVTKCFFTIPDANDMCWKLVCGSLMSGQNTFACT